MLPPKLAQILINLCGDLPKDSTILDPFCGTGVVLQEASLMGYKTYGTDLSERMIEYSEKNLKWLDAKDFKVEQGDATEHTWTGKIDAVACETYLGAPMSLPPVDIKLKEQKAECSRIILGFLKNISAQIEPGTPLAIAVPAWLRPNGYYERLNILDSIEDLGYNVLKFNHLGQTEMLYHRDGQVVAREIIVLRKK
jgi:tRNA (guanine10-N2)-dimethyltransferase